MTTQWVPAGHYYSPIPAVQDVERAITTTRLPLDIPLDIVHMTEVASTLEWRFPKLTSRWKPNPAYGPGDSALLSAMLRRFRPKHIVEVGSGYSTAVMLDTRDDFLPNLEITCVEPYPDTLRKVMLPGDEDAISLIQRPVQDIDPESIARELKPGDFLFMDSTHVVKPGSDVVHLILHTLPLIRPGVIVHIHDIHWPYQYPSEWLLEGRAWNEVYLVQAYLSGNRNWQIAVFASWLWGHRPDLLPEDLRGYKPAALWLVKTM